MRERLQKIIAYAGICSRRRAEELISSGRVLVNGRQAKLGDSAEVDTDEIVVNGHKIEPIQHLVYYAVNKPKGYVSSLVADRGEKIVTDLVPTETRVFPVGRLDKDSEGLMILTNDGELAQQLTHPSFEHEKEYEVLASYQKGTPRQKIIEKIRKLEKGVKIDDFVTSPANVSLKKISDLIDFKMVIHEGYKRQIRRMCDKVGFSVEKLTRTRIAKLELGNLASGKYKIIERKDII